MALRRIHVQGMAVLNAVSPIASAPEATLDRLASFIQQYPKLCVLSGAGCSTASGIADYRDHNGEWKQSQPVHFQEFISSAATRQRYWARSMVGWRHFAQAQPNAAHHALAQLEQAGFVHQLITQNVDGLHQQAGHRRVIDLHGRLDKVDCLACKSRFNRTTIQSMLEQRNPDFLAVRATHAPDGDAHLHDVNYSDFHGPDCPRCGGLLKPNVVFFGENVPRPRVERALQRLSEAQALLVVGSSLMVFSGYRFCRAAREQYQPIAAINLGRMRADDVLTLKIAQPCEEALSAVLKYLNLPTEKTLESSLGT